MGRTGVVVAVMVVAWVRHWVWRGMQEPFPPSLDPNPWWGPGNPHSQDNSIRQFRINVSQEDLEDLHKRLALPSRLTPGLEDAGFTYGFNGETLGKLVEYWQKEYRWREREERLNTYPHYRTQIHGLDIHFLHARAEAWPGVVVVPLLMLHGWPGSFVEFYEVLPLLTHPEERGRVAFEVVCPSIPGYGFSQPAAKKGLGSVEVAHIFLRLMQRLGHDRFVLQGGDWGSIIATDMATLFPESIIGLHLNMFKASTSMASLHTLLGAMLPAGLLVDKAEQHLMYPLSEKFGLMLRETGYFHIQATKPDTVGLAVAQSPVGLAAYILEKFSTGTNLDYVDLPDGGLLQPDFPISRDVMLDNLCIYWFTNSITTAMRFYAENGVKIFTNHMNKIPCRVPTGLAAFPNEGLNLPRSIVSYKFHNIVTYRAQPTGGHFAAMEQPHLLAADIHHFVKEVLRQP